MSHVPVERGNPFWRFSLAVYKEPRVAEECLAVQDKLGGDVNVLLYCVWTGVARGERLTDELITACERRISAWNAAAVHPLRTARRAIKGLPDFADPTVAAFRKELAALELAAEEIAQAMLYAQAPAIEAVPADASGEAAADNVRRYLTKLQGGIDKPRQITRVGLLLEAAVAHAPRVVDPEHAP